MISGNQLSEWKKSMDDEVKKLIKTIDSKILKNIKKKFYEKF
jgi:hypothetical protein